MPDFLSIIADSEYFFSSSIDLNKTTSLFTTLTFNLSDFERNNYKPFIKSFSGLIASISNLSKPFSFKSLAKKV